MTVWRSIAISAVPVVIYIVVATVVLGAACWREIGDRACVDRILEVE